MSTEELSHSRFFHSTENHPSYFQGWPAHISGNWFNRTSDSSPWRMHVSSREEFNLGFWERHRGPPCSHLNFIIECRLSAGETVPELHQSKSCLKLPACWNNEVPIPGDVQTDRRWNVWRSEETECCGDKSGIRWSACEIDLTARGDFPMQVKHI